MTLIAYAYSSPTPFGAASIDTSLNQTRVLGGSIRFNTDPNASLIANTIDTRSLNLSMFVRSDKNTMIQTTELIRFDMILYFADGSAQVLWYGETTDPMGGFSVPRKMFPINSSNQSPVSYIEITATYVYTLSPDIPVINHQFLYSSSNDNGVYMTTDIPPDVDFVGGPIDPVFVSYDGSESETVTVPILVGGSDVGSDLRWYVCSKNYLTVDDIPSVTFDPENMLLNISRGALYNDIAYIVAVNSTGASTALGFQLVTAQTPVILQIDDIVASMSPSMDFFQDLQQSAEFAGDLSWNISPTYTGLSISSKGQLRFERREDINTIVTVTATNKALGTSQPISFHMNVAQTPELTKIGNVFRSLVTTQPYRFDVPDIALNNKSALTWTLTTGGLENPIGSNAITINRTTGQITVSPSIYTHDIITVIATNPAGGYDNYTFEIHLSQIPSINIPNLNTNISIGSNAIYTVPLSQSSQFVGSVTWKITSVSPNIYRKYISLNDNLNSIVISLSSSYVDADVTLQATNIVGGYDTDTIHVLAAQLPIIIPSSPSINIVLDHSDLNFSFSNSPIATGTGTISWSIQTSSSNLLIDSVTGNLTLPYSCNEYIYETVGIVVTNQFGASQTLPVFMDIQHIPVFDSNSSYFTVVNGTNNILATMQLGQNFVFDANVLFVPDTGVRTQDLSWSFNSSVSTLASIDTNSGIITVPTGNRVVSVFTLSVITSAGGTASISFILNVVQATNIFNPYIIVQNTDTSPFLYQMRQTANGTGLYTWSLGNFVNGVSMLTSDTGILQVARATYVDSDIQVRTTNTVTSDIQSIIFHLHVAQKPVLNQWTSIVGSMYGDVNFIFSASDYVSTNISGTGVLTWQISPFIGLSIDQTGLVTFEHHNNITDYVTVTVYNSTGGSDAYTFFMVVVQKGDLVALTDFQYSMPYKTSLRLPLDTTTLALNAVSWSISPPIPPSVGIFNTVTGLITIYFDNWIDQVYTITVLNDDDTTQSESFRLSVAQTPVYSFNTSSLRITYPAFTNTSINMANYRKSKISGEGPLTWSLSRTLTGVTINNNGIITITSATKYFNDTMTVTATNIGGGTSSPQTRFIIAQTPDIRTIQNIFVSVTGSLVYYYTAFIVSPDVSFTGPIRWAIQPTDGNVMSGVSIDGFGRIIVAEQAFVQERFVSVTATNPANGVDTETFQLTIVRAPVIQPPRVNTNNLIDGIYISSGYTTPFRYTMVQTQVGTGSLIWSIASANPAIPLPSGISINFLSGILTIMPGIYDISVVVTAYNKAQLVNSQYGFASSTFQIKTITVPVLAPIANIVANHTNVDFTLQVVETSGNAGALIFYITNSPGLSISTSGLITFNKNFFVNRLIRVYAVNGLGNSSNTLAFTMLIGRTPVITRPLPLTITTNILPSDYTTAFTQTQSGTGPLTWTLRNHNGPLVINPVTGIVTLSYGKYFDGNLTIRVSNIVNAAGYDEVTFSYRVYQLLDISSTVIAGGIIRSSQNTLTDIYYYTELANAYAAQALGVGTLIWTIQPTSSVQNTWLSINNQGQITYAAGRTISENVTVTYTNALGYTVVVPFNMVVVQRPIIYNPGTFFITSDDVDGVFTYQYTSIIPVEQTLALSWDATNIDGITINETTGLFTYSIASLTGNQNLFVGTSEYKIVTDTMTSQFVPQGGAADILLTKTLSVSASCDFVYATQSTCTMTMNRSLGAIAMEFPANFIFVRQFDVTATNVAVGYDSIRGELNLENVRIIVRPETILQIQRTPQYTATASSSTNFKIASDDANALKTRAPIFTPTTISGGMKITMTWSIAPIAKVTIAWKPATSYIQPVVLQPGLPSPYTLQVPGFANGTQYIFTYTIDATPTTLSETRTLVFTPTSINPASLISISPLSGATILTFQVICAYSTSIRITWTPTTSQAFIQSTLTAGIRKSFILDGFTPNTTYTFTYFFGTDADGLYSTYTDNQVYTTNYLPLNATINQPVVLETEQRVTLSWSLPPRIISDVVITFTPASEFLSEIVVPLTSGIFSYTTTQLILGQRYTITYQFSPDTTGVYGPDVYTSENIIVRGIPNASINIPSGGTTVSLAWNIVPNTYCIIGWGSGSYNVAADTQQVSITGFTINTPYRFVYSFSPPGTREWPPARLIGQTTVLFDQATYGVGISNPYYVTASQGSGWSIFDKTSLTSWQGNINDFVDLTLPQTISLYGYQVSVSAASGAPTSWRIDGFNPSTNAFVALHTIANVAWSNSVLSNSYFIGNESNYTRYRITLMTPGSITELRLYEMLSTAIYSDITHLPLVLSNDYTTVYISPNITVNSPSFVSVSAVRLSWTFNGTPPTSGAVTFAPPPYEDVNGNTVYDPNVVITFNSSTTSLVVQNLVLGYPYQFGYSFDPDASGVYGPLSINPIATTVKTIPYVIFDNIIGGTKLQMSWRLFYIDALGVPQRLSQYNTTITWSPTTISMGIGKLVTNQDSTVISGFDGDGATSYRFTFSFAQTPLTYAYTVDWSYNDQTLYTPQLIDTDIPTITVVPTKTTPGLATLNISWVYGYTYDSQFIQTKPNVKVTWALVSVAFSQNTQVLSPATSVLLSTIVWGQTYLITFEFSPDEVGISAGQVYDYVYIVPTNPVVVIDTPTVLDTSNVQLSWTIDIPTSVTIVATPPSQAFGNPIITTVDSSTTTAILTGLLRTVYQVKFTFAASPLLWLYETTIEYNNT
jgi:hypothetical protein